MSYTRIFDYCEKVAISVIRKAVADYLNEWVGFFNWEKLGSPKAERKHRHYQQWKNGRLYFSYAFQGLAETQFYMGVNVGVSIMLLLSDEHEKDGGLFDQLEAIEKESECEAFLSTMKFQEGKTISEIILENKFNLDCPHFHSWLKKTIHWNDEFNCINPNFIKSLKR